MKNTQKRKGRNENGDKQIRQIGKKRGGRGGIKGAGRNIGILFRRYQEIRFKTL